MFLEKKNNSRQFYLNNLVFRTRWLKESITLYGDFKYRSGKFVGNYLQIKVANFSLHFSVNFSQGLSWWPQPCHIWRLLLSACMIFFQAFATYIVDAHYMEGKILIFFLINCSTELLR